MLIVEKKKVYISTGDAHWTIKPFAKKPIASGIISKISYSKMMTASQQSPYSIIVKLKLYPRMENCHMLENSFHKCYSLLLLILYLNG